MHYEVEVKVEITPELAVLIKRQLNQANSVSSPQGLRQIDIYVGSTVSASRPQRLRVELDESWFPAAPSRCYDTKKHLELGEMGWMNLVEDQTAISWPRFAKVLSSGSLLAIVEKRRWSCINKRFGYPITVSIDVVKFEHCLETRVFLEPEVLTEKEEQIGTLKAQILTLISELINVPVADIKPSAGLYAIASKRLEPETVYD